jgi:hypothetical protein
VKDLLPRLVVGFTLSAVGVPLCGLVIETANALIQALVGRPAAGPRVVAFVQARIVAATGEPAAALLAVVLGLLIVVLFYLLLVSWFARVAALVVLAGLAPVALACYALPYTSAAARLWWRALLGCLAVPALQAVVFAAGVDLLLDPDYNVPVLLGVGPAPSLDVFNLFLAACLLWLTVRVPRLVARYVTRAGGPPATAGVVLRAVVIQSVTRRLRLPGRRSASGGTP